MKVSAFAVIYKDDLILRKKLERGINQKDLKTLKLIEQAWEDIEKGRFKRAPPKKFFKELANLKRQRK
jgi:hypothetical protein